jgi:membrane protein DedA with SNARE-associated domain/rhodanese-related sulfurtransferase
LHATGTVTAYAVLAASAFAGQSALVIPIVPLLVSAGALAARGELHAGLALAAGIVPGDTVWYWLGRKRGRKILGRICRASLEPDTCVRRTQGVLGRWGARTLLVAKFIPGLSTVALPMAGTYGMKLRRFLLFDTVGVLAWCGAYVAIGYFSAQQIANLAPGFQLDWRVVAGLVTAAGLYLLWKYLHGRRQVRRTWVDRLTPESLRDRQLRGEQVAVVDLRHELDFEAEPYTIPGALYIPAEQVAERHAEVPRGVEVIVYCTCPDEATSARAAVRLRRRGLSRVRPLEGGFDTWRARGYPIEFRGPALEDDQRLLNAA